MSKAYKLSEMLKLGAMASVITVALPGLGLAEATVSDLVTTVAQTQLPVLPYILSAVCYVGGAFMMISGTLSLKKHAENPASEPLSKGVSRLLTGGAISAVPAITGLLQDTVFQEQVDRPVFQDFQIEFNR